MSFYLFNSPVLTAWGNYDYQGPLNTQQARLLLPADFISAIGHESTAILLSELLNRLRLWPVAQAGLNHKRSNVAN